MDAVGDHALLERDGELGRLGDRLAAARSGAGGLVLVEGAAGVGRTSLLRARAGATGDTRVLSAFGGELERGVSFGLVQAASGLTDRQIAEALCVTRKTVEFQLGAASSKLGIRSRGELPAALGTDGT